MAGENFPLQIPFPKRGLYERPNLLDPEYPLDAAPELLNLRITDRSLKPRLGFTAWKAIGGSGTVHFLHRFCGSNGTNYTLAARGGVLYQQTGVGAFAGATNGTGLGTAPYGGQYRGVTLKGQVYFLDGTGGLRKWNSTDGVLAVTQGTAPTAAPATKRTVWGYLVPAAITANKWETWQGSAGSEPTGWDDTAAVVATVADSALDSVPDFPGGGNVLKVAIASSGSKNDDVKLDAATEIALASHHVALFFQQDAKRVLLSLGLGQNREGEFEAKIDPPEADQTYLWAYPLGNLPSVKSVRLRCRRVPASAKVFYCSPFYLPGRLDGKYRYRISFANPTLFHETSLGPASEFVDCSTPLTNYVSDGTASLEKSVELHCGENTLPAVDTLTKVKFYRNGGLPPLTKDARGGDVWLLLHSGGNINSSVATNASMGDLVLDVVANEGAENLAAGDWIVLEPGVAGKEELVLVASVAQDFSTGKDRITLDASTPLRNAHTASTSNLVKPAYKDNTANEAIDVTSNTLPERNDLPSGCHHIARAPDGRLWAADRENVYLSNLPTAVRPWDHEVFPDDVEPLTRGSLLQGFNFPLDGDAHGDRIVWAGFFQRVYTVLTTRACYQIHCSGQSDWSPQSVVKLWDNLGCASPHSVVELNGILYWVADGPRVVAWDGQSKPRDLGFQRLADTLGTAPAAYVEQWFGLARADKEGARYDLFLTPSGASTNTRVLSYNAVLDAWEPHVYYASSAALPWAAAVYQQGPGDSREVYAAHPTSGDVRQLESGTTDNGDAIPVAWSSRKVFFDGWVAKAERLFAYYVGTGADTLSFRVRMSDSEYRNTSLWAGTDGDPAQTVSKTLADTDTSEAELYHRLDWMYLKGRSLQIRVSGTVSNGPQINRVEVRWSRVRKERLTP